MIASAINGEEVIRKIMILNGAVLAVAAVGYVIYLSVKLGAKRKQKAGKREDK